VTTALRVAHLGDRGTRRTGVTGHTLRPDQRTSGTGPLRA